jgi:hypothetical protein
MHFKKMNFSFLKHNTSIKFTMSHNSNNSPNSTTSSAKPTKESFVLLSRNNQNDIDGTISNMANLSINETKTSTISTKDNQYQIRHAVSTTTKNVCASMCIAVFEDKNNNPSLYAAFLGVPQDTCKIVFRLCVDDVNYYDYTFINNLDPVHYSYVRFYLCILSLIGFTEKEIIASVAFGSFIHVISNTVNYWLHVLSRQIGDVAENPILLPVAPKKMRLHEIHTYSNGRCIERICVNQ